MDEMTIIQTLSATGVLGLAAAWLWFAVIPNAKTKAEAEAAALLQRASIDGARETQRMEDEHAESLVRRESTAAIADAVDKMSQTSREYRDILVAMHEDVKGSRHDINELLKRVASPYEGHGMKGGN